MSKMKTRKAAAKRMTVTAGGKIKHRKAGLTHLQTKRSSRTQQRIADRVDEHIRIGMAHGALAVRMLDAAQP